MRAAALKAGSKAAPKAAPKSAAKDAGGMTDIGNAIGLGSFSGDEKEQEEPKSEITQTANAVDKAGDIVSMAGVPGMAVGGLMKAGAAVVKTIDKLQQPPKGPTATLDQNKTGIGSIASHEEQTTNTVWQFSKQTASILKQMRDDGLQTKKPPEPKGSHI